MILKRKKKMTNEVEEPEPTADEIRKYLSETIPPEKRAKNGRDQIMEWEDAKIMLFMIKKN